MHNRNLLWMFLAVSLVAQSVTGNILSNKPSLTPRVAIERILEAAVERRGLPNP